MAQLFNISGVIKTRCAESEKGNIVDWSGGVKRVCVCVAPEALVCLSPTCSTWGGRGLRGSGGKWDTEGLLAGRVCVRESVCLWERGCVLQYAAQLSKGFKSDFLSVWVCTCTFRWRTYVAALVCAGTAVCDVSAVSGACVCVQGHLARWYHTGTLAQREGEFWHMARVCDP